MKVVFKYKVKIIEFGQKLAVVEHFSNVTFVCTAIVNRTRILAR